MNKGSARRAATVAALAACAAASGTAQVVSAASLGLADMSLEQLSDIEVTSVSGRAESLQHASASIYVITGEEIRRSAATSLPEALRLAPNLQVARLNAAQYAISARGFNNAIGNKLLVLIDGRTVYSPLFSGVFWDANDVVLEDVERIEVISGPGGTIWGANAVNGVINVVTKPAAATTGALVSVARSGAGGYEVGRWGARLGEVGHYRLYAMAMDHDNTSRADGVERPDAASKRQVGFRSDVVVGGDRLTVQGDAYEGGKDPANNLAPKMSGANLVARWDGHMANGSPFKLQAILDEARRDDVTAFRDRSSTVDVQFSHEPTMPAGHQLLWGAGYRRTRGVDEPSAPLLFLPGTRTLGWTNAFIQDEWALTPSLELALGIKAEHNDYTGTELLPSARLSYQHSAQDFSWLSLSRAVRAPARLDRDFYSPSRPPYFINGGPNFVSEIAKVLEVGHRGFLAPRVSYSIAAFHQRYEHLRSGSPPPVTLINQIEGSVNGVEGWGSWQVADPWRLSAGFLQLGKHLGSTRGTPDPGGVASLGNDPRRQWMLRSTLNLGTRGELDVVARHVGALPSPVVEAYTAVDVRLAVKVTPTLELSLVGQNLFDPRHVEFNPVNVASQIERRLFVKAVWQLER